MESPGEYLKREREQRKVPLSKIFECTRVPMKYLEALEADNHGPLPHPTFVKGYIKSYCKCLGLDETDAVLRYELFLKEKGGKEEEIAAPREEVKKPPLLFAPAAKDELKRDSLPLLRSYGNIIALAVAGVAAVAVIYVATSRRHASPPAAVTQTAAPEAVTAAPEVSAQTALPPQAPAPVAAVKPAAPAASTVEPAKAVVKPAETVAAKPVEPVKALQPAAPKAAAATAAAEKKEPAVASGHLLVARARETTWIKLIIDGGEPFDVVLRAGEKVAWKADKGYDVVVGNAGGVALSLDGQEVAGLGKAGEVVKLILPNGASAAKSKDAAKALVKPVKAASPESVSPAGSISASTAARPAAKKASPEKSKAEPATVDAPGAAVGAEGAKPKSADAPKWDTTPKNRFEVRPADESQ
jgi:cytoskeleton protein RodZ